MSKTTARARALLLLSAAIVATTAAADSTIRVLTFNILASEPEWEKNAKAAPWAKRMPVALEVMLKHPDGDGPYDFIGTQETAINDNPALHQVNQLGKAMTGYGSLAAPSTGKAKGFSLTNMIFWRKDRWEMDPADHGTFWLSSTPDVPGSRDWGSPRCVTYGLFHETNDGRRRTGRKVYFYNTHLHVHQPPSRTLSAILILERIKSRKAPAAPVILTGDFNSRRTTQPYLYLTGQTINFDERDRVPPFALREAFAFANPGTRNPPAIDFIFCHGGLRPLSAEIIRTTCADIAPSDHLPVEAVLEIE
jgi:endonuclease/exonuclease/phosphatase family metal-dependent hydrolase